MKQGSRFGKRLESNGYSGLVDRRKARPSDKRIPVEKVEQVLRLYREEYFDLSLRHFEQGSLLLLRECARDHGRTDRCALACHSECL